MVPIRTFLYHIDYMEQSSQVITSSISSSILPSSLPESSQYSVYLFATADNLLLSVSIVLAKIKTLFMITHHKPIELPHWTMTWITDCGTI